MPSLRATKENYSTVSAETTMKSVFAVSVSHVYSRTRTLMLSNLTPSFLMFAGVTR